MGKKKSNPKPPDIINKPTPPPPPPSKKMEEVDSKPQIRTFVELAIPFGKFKNLLVDFLCNAIEIKEDDIVKVCQTDNEIMLKIKLQGVDNEKSI